MKIAKNQNTKALCLITAWLEAIGISFEVEGLPEGSFDAMGPNGTIRVSIQTEHPVVITADVLVLLSGSITHKNRDVAMTEFHKLTERLGVGAPLPVDRGVAPAKRIYGDDHDLTIMRHNQFRQCPNPPAHVFAKYEQVITTACRFFLKQNYRMCRKLGYDLDDLKSYARVWATNFYGTGRVINPKRDENERLLYKFLRQRFAEFHSQFVKRERSQLADRQTLQVALGIDFVTDTDTMRTVDGGLKAVQQPTPTADESAGLEEYRRRTNQLDLSNDRERRKSASALLEKHLQSMPHDQRVAVLTEASQNPHMCPDTRKEARRQLRLHTESCDSCATAVPANGSVAPDSVEVDELVDVGGVDPDDSVAA